MDNILYVIQVCAVLSIIGILIKITISSDQASLIGLGLVSLSLFGTMMMVLKYYYSTGTSVSCFKGAVLPSLVQLLLICAIVGILMYQAITSSTQNITSSEYTTFSTISSGLTFMQIFLTFYYLFLNMKCLSGFKSGNDEITSLGLMYLNVILTLLNVCALGIIQVILNKFYIC